MRVVALVVLGSMAVAAGAGAQGPDLPAWVKLQVRHGGARYAVDLAPAGAGLADSLLARYGRGTPGGERMRRIVARLLTPDYLAEAARVLEPAPAGTARVVLVPDDSVHRLVAGELLELPDGRRGAVGAGESLDRFGARHGYDAAAVQEVNGDRFAVWPHASFEWVKGARLARVSVGAKQLEGDRSDEDSLQGVFHELAHVGDTNPCREAHEHYGLDGKHYHDEILTPEAAFTEGWADWQSSHVAGAWAGWVRVRSLALRIEGSKPTADRYRWIESPELTGLDLLSNETMVAILLAHLEDLPPGRAGLAAAMKAMPARACRSVATFLATYVRLFPGEDRQLRAQLPATLLGRVSPADVDGLLAGRLPGGASPSAFPRPVDYLPSGRPVRIAEPPAGTTPGFEGIRILGQG